MVESINNTIVLTHHCLIIDIIINTEVTIVGIIGDERTIIHKGKLNAFSTMVIKMVVTWMSKMHPYNDSVIYSYDNLKCIQDKIRELLLEYGLQMNSELYVDAETNV